MGFRFCLCEVKTVLKIVTFYLLFYKDSRQEKKPSVLIRIKLFFIHITVAISCPPASIFFKFPFVGKKVITRAT